MPFTPLRFQSALAAGGLALMPFVLMQFTFERQGQLINWSDVTPASSLSATFLIAVMALGTAFHLGLILKLLPELFNWLKSTPDTRTFMADPAINVGIFSPVIALGMTVNVVLGPLAFFLPDFSRAVPELLSYGIYPYSLLFFLQVYLSIKVGTRWFFRDGQSSSYNFNWLLDVFAWGMVALGGAAVTMTAADQQVAVFASFLTLAAISIGLFIYAVKGFYLLLNQLMHGQTPANPLKPAHFVVIPINCLFGISIYRMADFTDNLLGIDIASFAFASVIILFFLSFFWTLFCALAFRSWFTEEFPKPDFYPPQWGLVCVLVALQVFALHSHISYYPSVAFIAFAYLSTALAAGIYLFVFMKFSGIYKKAALN